MIEEILGFTERNLFTFLHHSILRVCAHLGIGTEIQVLSGIGIKHDLKKQDKVLAMCAAMGASTYLNPPGGIALYQKSDFLAQGVELKFLMPREFSYPQSGGPFVLRCQFSI